MLSDPYHIIEEDEKKFYQSPEETAVSVEFAEQKSNLAYEQSWGIYFAHRSPAMGEISGTARMRVWKSLFLSQPKTDSI